MSDVEWTINVPARQGIAAGWRLLVTSLIAFIRRQDVTFEAGFTPKDSRRG